MNGILYPWLEGLFRWIHVVAGITWIGHLYFFNWVNSQVAKAYTPEGKKNVLPELMPRALYWFRWGAMYTWITGFLLAGVVYYMGQATFEDPAKIGRGAAVGISVAVILVPFFVYDVLWKVVKNEMAGMVISFILAVALAFGLSTVFSGRALFIHMGMLFGSIMMLNVWMRIWPAQKKIIAGVKGLAPAPDASIAAMAGLRSKHNTYMSVPLVFFMVSNHYSDIFNLPYNWAVAGGFIAVGWIFTKMLYKKSANTAATTNIGAPAAAPAAPAAAAAAPK